MQIDKSIQSPDLFVLEVTDGAPPQNVPILPHSIKIHGIDGQEYGRFTFGLEGGPRSAILLGFVDLLYHLEHKMFVPARRRRPLNWPLF
jgi:hypothetical protein